MALVFLRRAAFVNFRRLSTHCGGRVSFALAMSSSSSSSTSAATTAAPAGREVLFSLNFKLSGREVDEKTAEIISKYKTALDEIASAGLVGFAPFAALADADADAVIASSQVTLPALTSTDGTAREASTKAKQALREMWQEAYSRVDVFKVLQRAAEDLPAQVKVGSSGAADSEIRQRFVDKTLEAFRQNGCTAPDELRGRYIELNQQCGRLASAFEQEINEDTSTIELTPEELAGCPEAFMAGLFGPADAPNTATAKVSMKAPTRVPVMQFALSAETRRRVQHVANSRCIETNEPRLAKLLKARMDKAAILGFDTHADQMLQPKMVGSLAAAREFLLDIHRKLRPAAKSDLEALRALKKRDVVGDGDENVVVNSWDGAFYARKLKEELFTIDTEEVRKHFPMEHVKKAIFSIYQRLLGVSFTRISAADAGTALWHEEVDLYAVTDCETNELCGHFYLDLYSRDGKFGHQCVVPVVPSCNRGGKDQVPPACAILGNMTKPTPDRPSLLRFAEVHTFFHEFGHVMHAVLSHTPFTRFSWTWPMMPWPGGVEQDFLEVPSMFLEKLVYERDILQELSCHFETGARLDEETVEKLNRAQHFLAGRSWSRFIAMALYDLELHSQSPPYELGGETDLDLRGLWSKIMRDFGSYEGPEELNELAETFMPASWYHLVIGYDAGYYGYLYSEVFAYSILEKFKDARNNKQEVRGQPSSSSSSSSPSPSSSEEVPTFESLGRRYRRCILQPCASKDGAQMLQDFLGHEPNPSAFLKALGLTAEK